MFNVPDAELESFKASLVEAGFAPVFSEQVEYNNSPDELPEGAVRNADGFIEMKF